jgi:hypothetical protein
MADDVPADEERGLRGRLSSLIGRDLGDRDDESRVEPPLASAPVPRVDSTDRAIHSVSASDPPNAAPESVSPAPRQAPATAAAGGLGREDLRKLHAVLHELAECRKLIDAVVTRPH